MSRDLRTVLGIDLGGALQATTGYAVLAGRGKPALKVAGVLPKSRLAQDAEQALLDLLDRWSPDLVAVDAPLTLPPCLTCPSSCQGPAPDRCELRAASLVWEAGGNPVTERLCEVRLRREMGGGRPLPTMRVGQIAARGVAFARRLRAIRAERGAVGGPEAIEVYPAASLLRWGWGRRPLRGEGEQGERRLRAEVLARFRERVSGIDPEEATWAEDHALDALVAAYTGWLGPEDLEQPPKGFNAATGWIWLPEARGASLESLTAG